MKRYLLGFAAAGAFFGGIDGWVIAESTASTLVGALVGIFIGVGLVLLGWKSRPQDRTGREAAEGHHPPYMVIFVVLALLTGLEVGVAFLTMSKQLIVLTLLALAIWKALLVALYYMHLKFEPRRMWILAASPLPLALILVLAVLTEF